MNISLSEHPKKKYPIQPENAITIPIEKCHYLRLKPDL